MRGRSVSGWKARRNYADPLGATKFYQRRVEKAKNESKYFRTLGAVSSFIDGINDRDFTEDHVVSIKKTGDVYKLTVYLNKQT